MNRINLSNKTARQNKKRIMRMLNSPDTICIPRHETDERLKGIIREVWNDMQREDGSSGHEQYMHKDNTEYIPDSYSSSCGNISAQLEVLLPYFVKFLKKNIAILCNSLDLKDDIYTLQVRRDELQMQKEELEEKIQSLEIEKSEKSKEKCKLYDEIKNLSSFIEAARNQIEEQETELQSILGPLKLSAGEKISHLQEDSEIAEAFIRLADELGLPDEDLAFFKDLKDIDLANILDPRKINEIITFSINFESKFDFYIRHITGNNGIGILSEIADKLGFELINPGRGDVFVPPLHTVINEAICEDIPRGRVVKCESIGYIKGTSVIQKAGIIMSK